MYRNERLSDLKLSRKTYHGARGLAPVSSVLPTASCKIWAPRGDFAARDSLNSSLESYACCHSSYKTWEAIKARWLTRIMMPA